MRAAACIQRMPVVVPEMNDIESRFYQYTEQKNIEKSFLSDHELRHLKDV
jgi:hypothetical protein